MEKIDIVVVVVVVVVKIFRYVDVQVTVHHDKFL